MKKSLVRIFLAVCLIFGVGFYFPAIEMHSVAEAARSSVRMRSVMPMPRMSVPKPAPAPKAARPNQQYKASQKASEIPSQAPQSNLRGNTATQNPAMRQQPTSFWGSALRNFGLLAGGMALGHLLSRAFGFGGLDFMGDIFGLILNALVIFALFRVILWAISAFLNGNKKNDEDENIYASSWREQQQTFSQPSQRFEDIKPMNDHDEIISGKGGTDYQPKRTADWYRSH